MVAQNYQVDDFDGYNDNSDPFTLIDIQMGIVFDIPILIVGLLLNNSSKSSEFSTALVWIGGFINASGIIGMILQGLNSLIKNSLSLAWKIGIVAIVLFVA